MLKLCLIAWVNEWVCHIFSLWASEVVVSFKWTNEVAELMKTKENGDNLKKEGKLKNEDNPKNYGNIKN